jgi:hypothetical protein
MSGLEERERSHIQGGDNYILQENENSLIVDMGIEPKNNKPDSIDRNLDDIFDEYLGEKDNLSKKDQEGNLNIPPPSDYSENNEINENEENLEEENFDEIDENDQESNNSVDDDLNENKLNPTSNPLKKQSKLNRKKIEQNIRKYFLNNKDAEINLKDKLSTIDPSDNLFAFSKLKKLKKKSEIIKEKQNAKKISLGFLDVEAELGSDNEEHDDIVKKITDSDKEDDEQEEYLKDLINDDKLEEETDLLQKKYFDDMLERDRAEVKRVISGPQVEKKTTGNKRNRTENEEDDELTIEMRMKKFKSEEDEDSKDPQFHLKNLYKNFKSLEKKISENTDENHNDELIEMQQSIETKIMKEIAEKDNEHIKLLFNRMKENEKILEENVINLNCRSSNDDKNANKFLIRGSFNQMSQVNNSIIDNNSNKISLAPRVNHRNSFLHAMKNDKYFVKNENSLSDNINLKQQGSFDSNSNTSAGSNAGNTANTGTVSNNTNRSFPIFAGNPNKPNLSMNSNKSSNLSALFTRSNKNRHTESQTGSSNNSSKNKQSIQSPDFTPNKEKSLKNLL